MDNQPNQPTQEAPQVAPEGGKPRRSSNGAMLAGIGAALLAVVAVTAWFISRPGGGGGFTLTPTPTPTTLAASVITPTPFAGAATFTPVASSIISGPHVLGITAGVGMSRGDIAGAAPIAVTFSDEMDQASAQSAFKVQPAVQGDFRWQSNTLFFTPRAALQPATSYTVSVAKDAKTRGGSLLAAPAEASFKTAPAPSILRTLPSAGASEVPTDVVVTVSFNRPMIPLTALDSQPDPSQWVTISPAVQGRWVWLGTSAVGFRPSGAGFLPASNYTLEVKAGWPDAAGITLAQGTSATFATVKPAVLSVLPYNGGGSTMIDAPVVVRFNMPMNPATQGAFSLNKQAAGGAVAGSFEWSADSTVMTYTPSTLLSFSTRYVASFSGPVQPMQGNAAELVGGAQVNTWDFTTTDPTRVSSHYPDSSSSPAQPSNSFGFSFNNPIAPDQPIEQYLTISPQPEGYLGQLVATSSSAYTDGVKLKANTTYNFALRAGLKDKWGFEIPAANWEVKIGPLRPWVGFTGGTFQPIYSEGPSYVRVKSANLSSLNLSLYSLKAEEVRALLLQPYYYDPSGGRPVPGSKIREWTAQVPGGAKEDEESIFFTPVSANATGDRLARGYYLLLATAPNPYDATYPLFSTTVLMVGRNGVVTKMDAQGNMMLWVADLATGKPTGNYPLRIEQITSEYNGSETRIIVVGGKKAQTGSDGVARITLDPKENVYVTAVWSDGNDALVSTTGWNSRLDPWSLGVSVAYGDTGLKAQAYVDRPIYRPAQTVYFKGIYRLDDDAAYSLPKAGGVVEVRAWTWSSQGQTRVYTGTATLSTAGTISGQFLLPANAPAGNYTLSLSGPGSRADEYGGTGAAYASFSVEEYRKPDFRVDVTAQPERVKGDPITATVLASYYFGGPLQNVTATINMQASPYYFFWADPDTGETYQFGEYNPLPYMWDFYYKPGTYPTPEPVHTYNAQTDSQGNLIADVTRFITTTTGSKSVLIEGQVRDLSNQAVANSANTVVHQGLYYIGLRTADYIATAQEPTTITVRTVEWSGKAIAPNTAASLRFVRREWVAPADPSGEWKLNLVEVGRAAVTTDAQGRAIYLFTPPTAGEYMIEATGTDSRGNTIRTTTQFYVWDDAPGYYVPWRYKNDNAVQLVADKTKYQVGDTARILVTSPFSQATALLTIERGHVRRYSLITLQGSAPTVEVKLEQGDLPNVYVGLTLLGPGAAPENPPPDWVTQVALRQGYVNLSLDTSGKQLKVSLEPQGAGPYRPGDTAAVKVRATDKSGRPVQGVFSLAVVDEAIFALAAGGPPDLYNTFWAERGLGVNTSTSFTAGEFADGRGGGDFYGEGTPAAMPSTSGAAQDEKATRSNAGQQPSAPQKVRTDFRDTAFWTAEVSTGSDGTATIQVPFPDNLTTWRLTTAGITNDTLAGSATTPVTVTQPLLLRPVLPRFLTTGDKPNPQAIIHNNTPSALQIAVSLEVSGAIKLEAQPASEQTISVPAGGQAIVTWNATVEKGDSANFRFWARTADKTGPDYLEDAVGMRLPVKPFAAPEAVASSGEVQGVRGFESVLIPYSVNALLGELTVQVSPSLAAATTESLRFVKEYEYESTDQTVSRFLPLVVLEKVYQEQGLSTPYTQEIPGIVERSLKRLRELQQPDGGWSWWERGPSSWFETAYVVQGLTALREAGYSVPDDLLQPGLNRLRTFQGEASRSSFDETYNLNMRAYSLYVLSYAGVSDDGLSGEGSNLVAQSPRLSAHARAWLAMALSKMGMGAESKRVLDSLASAARQTSTTAHWEEDTPDYWSMSTDNRATALAIDALVTLAPNDPLVPKAVRWLMSAQKEGHWLSSQETSISLVSLAHYMRVSKELSADYIFQVDAFGKLLGQGAANSNTLTQTTTFTLPVSEMPVNTLGDINMSRSSESGKMYYQMSLKYYVPGEGIKSRSEGLAISRTYYRMAGGVASEEPVKEAAPGDLLKVRLMVVVPETAHYVRVIDPLPAGLEGVNGSLNTTSFTERPPDPRGSFVPDPVPTGTGSSEAPSSSPYYDSWYWRWGPFDNVEMRDDRTVLFATYMSPGTYVYEYYARATTPGNYMSLPAQAELLYYPDVFGRSDGGEFRVR